MAVLRDVSLPLANYPTGSRQVGPINVPDSARELYFEFARCTSVDPTIWPSPLTKLRMAFEGSTDGVNWTPAGGFGAEGGIHIRRDATEASLSSFHVPLPPLTGRQLRATVLIENGPLRTQGAIELRD